jgi:TPR repeat protein
MSRIELTAAFHKRQRKSFRQSANVLLLLPVRTARLSKRKILLPLILLFSYVAADAATWAGTDGLNDGLVVFARASYSDAIHKLTPLARHGDATAQLVLGKAFAAKDYASRDCASAKHWFRLSAEAGNPEASFELARLFQDKTCGLTNELAALRWYLEAYQHGWSEAATAIGEILLLDADYLDFAEQACDWFVRGAEHFDGFAALRLAQLYQVGLGIPADLATAFTWYDIAERQLPTNSDEKELALLMRDSIREQFTPAQVEKLLEQSQTFQADLWSTKGGT